MFDPREMPDPQKAIAKAWVYCSDKEFNMDVFTILDKEEVDEGVFNHLIEWEYPTLNYEEWWWYDCPSWQEAAFELPLCIEVIEWVEPLV